MNMGKLVMGYWDCPYCETRGIPGTEMQCPSCGRARGEVVFYMKDHGESLTLEQEQRGEIEYLDEQQTENVGTDPDWYCSFCNSLNRNSAETCTTCGASRADSESNYFDMLKKKQEQEAAELAAQPAASSAPGKRSRKPLTIFLVILAVIIAFTVFMNGNKTSGQTVTELGWSRTVTVEKNIECEEENWNLPDGAEVIRTAREIYRYNTVLDHYENVERPMTRQVIDHYETYYTYENLGNGAFEEVPHQRPVYTTEYYTETVRKPVYIQVPQYETKYYYKIRRWKVFREVNAHGGDHETVWPDPELGEDEREGEKTEIYAFSVTDRDGKKTTWMVDEATWDTLNAGDEVHITARRSGADPYLSDEKGNPIAKLYEMK